MLFENLPELHKHIDPSQLTADFGGRIAFDNEEWIQFHKVDTLLGIFRNTQKLYWYHYAYFALLKKKPDTFYMYHYM